MGWDAMDGRFLISRANPIVALRSASFPEKDRFSGILLPTLRGQSMSAYDEDRRELEQGRMDIIAEIEGREDALRSAMVASDVAALSALIDEGLVFTGPDGTVLGKDQDLSAHDAGILKLSKLDLFDRRLHRIGDNVLVTTKANLAGAFAGTPIDGTYCYTRLWSQASGQWRVIAGHAARLG